MSWQQIGELRPEEIQQRGIFPYPSLPHPLQTNGGQVFPKIQIDMFPRLERFDVDHDLPETFLPEFPPAIFLNNRPKLGDVSRGEVVSINNFYRLFKDILTPVQLDGLQFLLTPFPAGRVSILQTTARPASRVFEWLLPGLSHQRTYNSAVSPLAGYSGRRSDGFALDTTSFCEAYSISRFTAPSAASAPVEEFHGKSQQRYGVLQW